MKRVAGSFPPEVKRLGREANHLPLSSAEIKNERFFTSIPLCLNDLYRENFIYVTKNYQGANILLDLYLVVSGSNIGLVSGYPDSLH